MKSCLKFFFVDGELYTETEKTAVSWNLKKGAHSVWAEVLYRGATVFEDAEPVNFIVK